ncbi:purine-cytosine permease [Podospora australis]|uniref:Purine-cytosine permease n=1 Tax=Podospora australis TaxID=1536484 RepID=A0AAN6X5I8_9PEZI|nr:purine-cytosine permease [Podospora australis]
MVKSGKGDGDRDVERLSKEVYNVSEDRDSTSDDAALPGVVTVVHKEDFEKGDSLYAKLQRFAGKYGMEQRGVERVPDDEREDVSAFKIGRMWFSVNMGVSTFALGAVAVPIFHLGYLDTILVIIFINALGLLPVSFFSTFGPKFGLRQMMLSRFWFGYYGTKILACFQIIVCMGWASVSAIVGAQLFHAVNGDMPSWTGILIVAASTLVICTFGHDYLHLLERYAWIPCLIIYIIVIGVFAHTGDFDNLLPMSTGPSEAASVLSFSAAIWGFACGWAAFSADYSVYLPASRPTKEVFFWTFGGIYVPLVFLQGLGAAVATAVVNQPDYLAAYLDSGIGGLLSAVLVPTLGKFGDFCVVIMALSIIAGNCPNLYSVSFSLQVLARKTQRVPRFIWSAAASCVCFAISVPGYDHFEAWLENFVLITGYWVSVYSAICVTDHFVFRRSYAAYKIEDFANPKALPPGFAAIGALVMGIVGVVLGMSQIWFTGPISKLCGDGTNGGDVGAILGFGMSSLSYLVFRTAEKNYFRR